MPSHFALRSFAARLLLAAVASVPIAVIAAPTEHPILARISVSETLSFTGTQPCFAYSVVKGSGQAPSMGNFTVTSQDCVNPLGAFDASRPNANSFAFASTAVGLVFITGTGDRIFAAYSGTATPNANGPLRLAGQFIVTGGTGAYFAATGGGVVFGHEDLSQVVAAQGEITIFGVLLY